jgi:hypothetical protein
MTRGVPFEKLEATDFVFNVDGQRRYYGVDILLIV